MADVVEVKVWQALDTYAQSVRNARSITITVAVADAKNMNIAMRSKRHVTFQKTAQRLATKNAKSDMTHGKTRRFNHGSTT
jgi:hypothetical protein